MKAEASILLTIIVIESCLIAERDREYAFDTAVKFWAGRDGDMTVGRLDALIDECYGKANHG